VPKKSGAGGGA